MFNGLGRQVFLKKKKNLTITYADCTENFANVISEH